MAAASSSSSRASLANGSTSLPHTEAGSLQLIDEHKQFSAELPGALREWQLYDVGFAYDVVAVFGSQSTGKSTLLNRLFGTEFAVMGANDRRQTTKGIWLAKARSANALVMDVEGTDGRERGEDQDFERKSALFSLATAECIILNLWEHQIGLYQGANMGLLKTVMEVNLALFQAKAKGASTTRSLLMFVIRDHIGATPLANLRATLVADLERLWHSISKPEGLEVAKVSDYFDLAFATLPHKLLQPEHFDDACKQLRRRFDDRSDPDYVFKPAYHKRIPADGLSVYLESVWESIMANKDLDLPTQQELLAQFRCDEIAAVAFSEFEQATAALHAPVSSGSIVGTLGATMKSARESSVSSFDRDASRYHAGVYQRKRAELLAKMAASLSPLFLGQLKNLHKQVLKQYRADISDGIRQEGYDFGSVVQSSRARAEKTFTGGAEAMLLSETTWSFTDAHAQLQEELSTIADTARAEETRKMVASIERNLKRQLAEPTEAALNRPSPIMWDAVLTTFRDALQKAEATYTRRAKSFDCTDAENEHALASLRQRAWLALRKKVDDQTAPSILLVTLKLAFEERFRYDEHGVPRIWRPDDDIDALFRTAKDETLALIALYGRVKPSEPELLPTSIPSGPALDAALDEDDHFDFESSLVVLSEAKQSDLASRFRREADAYYVEAKRSMVSSISQIPRWMYGVVLLLGWNELVAVLRSPVYFTMLALLAAAAYVVYQLNLQGPVLAVAQGGYNAASKALDDRLREHFGGGAAELSQRMTAPIAAASPRAPSDDIELRDKSKDE